jgi:hypothetical protein
MALHTALIGGVQVAGFRYVIYGPRRGFVSTHRTQRAALRALAEDARRCQEAGRPSDAQVYRWRDGWELVGQGGSNVAEVVSQQDSEIEDVNRDVGPGLGGPSAPKTA